MCKTKPRRKILADAGRFGAVKPRTEQGIDNAVIPEVLLQSVACQTGTTGTLPATMDRIRGKIEAPRAAFVGLTYLNPPGGSKICLNSKVAGCEVTLERGGEARTFATKTRAAFEILTDGSTHGVPLLGE